VDVAAHRKRICPSRQMTGSLYQDLITEDAMRFLATLLIVAVCGACAPADQPAEEQADQPTGPTLADFAGTWQSTATLEGVEEPVPTTMSGSADGSDWTMTLEGRPDIPVQVTVVGDSLIAETDEYESVLREGVMVQVRTASVLQDGTLMGNLVATYKTAEGDEVVTGTLQGTRAPN